MRGKHRARSFVRSATSALLAVTATAAAYVVTESGANAANPDAACSAAAVNLNAPSPVRLAWANPRVTPCATDTKSVLTASAVMNLAPLGLGTTRATVSTVTSRTSEGWTPLGYAITASSDIAKVTIAGPGINVVASGVHSDVTVLEGDGLITSANAWITSLTVNGIRVNVAKNKPLVVPVGLRISLYVDYRTVGYGAGNAVPLAMSFPDHRYNLIVAQSSAILGCNCN